jgi:hypothetical protein
MPCKPANGLLVQPLWVTKWKEMPLKEKFVLQPLLLRAEAWKLRAVRRKLRNRHLPAVRLRRPGAKQQRLHPPTVHLSSQPVLPQAALPIAAVRSVAASLL